MNAIDMIAKCAQRQSAPDPLPESFDTRLEPMGWKAAVGAGAVLLGCWVALIAAVYAVAALFGLTP